MPSITFDTTFLSTLSTEEKEFYLTNFSKLNILRKTITHLRAEITVLQDSPKLLEMHQARIRKHSVEFYALKAQLKKLKTKGQLS